MPPKGDIAFRGKCTLVVIRTLNARFPLVPLQRAREAYAKEKEEAKCKRQLALGKNEGSSDESVGRVLKENASLAE